eukprot:356114-Chlamydomonas_euryale.AAC.8
MESVEAINQGGIAVNMTISSVAVACNHAVSCKLTSAYGQAIKELPLQECAQLIASIHTAAARATPALLAMRVDAHGLARCSPERQRQRIPNIGAPAGRASFSPKCVYIRRRPAQLPRLNTLNVRRIAKLQQSLLCTATSRTDVELSVPFDRPILPGASCCAARRGVPRRLNTAVRCVTGRSVGSPTALPPCEPDALQTTKSECLGASARALCPISVVHVDVHQPRIRPSSPSPVWVPLSCEAVTGVDVCHRSNRSHLLQFAENEGG